MCVLGAVFFIIMIFVLCAIPIYVLYVEELSLWMVIVGNLNAAVAFVIIEFNIFMTLAMNEGMYYKLCGKCDQIMTKMCGKFAENRLRKMNQNKSDHEMLAVATSSPMTPPALSPVRTDSKYEE